MNMLLAKCTLWIKWANRFSHGVAVQKINPIPGFLFVVHNLPVECLVYNEVALLHDRYAAGANMFSTGTSNNQRATVAKNLFCQFPAFVDSLLKFFPLTHLF